MRGQISAECIRLGRPQPTLIVVTKNHPVELVQELTRIGENNFGENRVQEGLPKALQLAELEPGKPVNWHLIGQLQTNKVKQALEFANSVHSLDRESLLIELVKRTAGRQKPLEVFIQVNLTDDDSRGGVHPGKVLSFADQVAEVDSLKLAGLMAVASLNESPDHDFDQMAELSQRLTQTHQNATGLSIGMSGDFLQALAFGATHLRIGTAITGNRVY